MGNYHAVTIKDIAQKFNCSPSTVSRALSDHYSINEQTRKTICSYAEEVGYQRNSISLSLLNKASGSLGIIVPTISSYYESSIIEGLFSVLQPLGYSLHVCVTNESSSCEIEYINKLLANRVEGIFLSIAQETYDRSYYEHLENVVKRGVPLIFIDRECERISASKVIVDDYLGAYAIVEHLVAMGCQRIAHLKGPNGITVSQQRFKGYIDCLRDYNLPLDEELIITTDFNINSGVLPTQQLLDLPNPPDAIFGVNDQIVIGAMRVIQDRNLKIPEDIALAGFDDSPVSAFTYPSLTTLARPGRGVGLEASQLFLRQVKGETHTETVRLPSHLVVRESSCR
ncbi:MAG: LacI family DNA-binding transcriptional regulator [Siphonobacter sp.]